MKRCAAIVFMACMVLALWSSGAQAWWNEEWKFRIRMTIDTTASGADLAANVDEVPVLVRLHSGALDFTHMKDDGSDIRFVSGDDTTQLKHHLEQFDPTDEIAQVWVRVPKVKGSDKQDCIWMYYGNEDAEKSDDAKGTYDKNHLAVFHFAEAQGMPQDSTGYGNHATVFSGSLGLPSIIGKGATLSSSTDRIVIQSNPTLDLSGGFTFSAWIRMSAPQQDAYLLHREENGSAITVGIDKDKLFCRVKSGKDETLMTPMDSTMTLGEWHHVAVSSQHQGKLFLYVDGAEVYGIDLSPTLPNVTGDIALGASTAGDHAFIGDLDEVALSNTARNATWVKSQFASQAPKGTLLAPGAEETSKGGGMGEVFGYMVIIIKFTSLSGWVIIAVIMAMFAFCSVVFIDKANTIRAALKSNKAFLAEAEGSDDYLNVDAEGKGYEDSPIYRVYADGCELVRNRMRNSPKGAFLSGKAISSFKAEMEREAMRETQRLNSRLVLFTVAIAGGPFLGLLGTVWGVMNTFAAMAQAGEANIMAIAPGIASALSTTVFGLILAIPALFAYNYMTTRIKDIIADMYLFIDEFETNVEMNYGDEALMWSQSPDRRTAS